MASNIMVSHDQASKLQQWLGLDFSIAKMGSQAQNELNPKGILRLGIYMQTLESKTTYFSTW